MPENHITSYPLYWPTGWKRHQEKISSRFSRWDRKITIAKAASFVIDELRKMGIPDFSVIISSDVELRQDGLPYSNRRLPKDAGIAVWWQDKKQQRVIALDQYRSISDNLYAIGKTIEAMRGIERWGGGEILERTFTGFTALPDLSKPDWWTVLGASEDDNHAVIKSRYKLLAQKYHPDNQETGDSNRFIEIKSAYDQSRKELDF